MSEVPPSDWPPAFGMSVRPRMALPDAIRVTELPVWPVRGITADQIAGWAKFRGAPPSQVARAVGLVGVATAQMKELWHDNATARLGIARAVGRSVVFGPVPRGTLSGPDDLPDVEYQFAVRLGPDPTWVTPALRLDDGSLRVPESGVRSLVTTSIDFVRYNLPRVRVY